MKHAKKLFMIIIMLFTFFFGMVNSSAGVPSLGFNPQENSNSNTKLRYLFVYDYDLTPNFDSDVYEYEIIAPPKTDNIKISYRTASKFSTVEVSDTNNLTNGSIVTITVKAQNGTTKEYKLMLRYSNSKLLYIILMILIVIILLTAIGGLVAYILWKKGIIKITKKVKKNIGSENYVK